MKKKNFRMLLNACSITFISIFSMACHQGDEITPSDYTTTSNWLACPTSITKNVDVFYLYPTSWGDTGTRDSISCGIDNATMRKYAILAYDRQATAFKEDANIFAPYYRQVDASYTLGLSQNEREEVIREIPYTDALAAFEYYIEHFNNNRPFILAGHSQGSNVLVHLLSDYMQSHPDVYKRMVAAYVIGYSITDEYLKLNKHLKFAEGADDTGVIVSYNTEAPNVTKKNPVLMDNAIAINPITWTREETEATIEQSLGSRMYNSDKQLVDVLHYANAKVDKKRGVVICSSVDTNSVKYTDPFKTGMYHSYDYPFYYYNIRANAAERIKKFLK